MLEALTEFLDKQESEAMLREDDCELELGLARTMFASTPQEIADLKKELKIWREILAFIKSKKEKIKEG